MTTPSDLDPLVGSVQPRSRLLRTKILCPLLFLIGCTALLCSVLIGYFNYKVEDAFALRVLSMNTWGMPELFGAKDKAARMDAIGKMIARQEYDLYLLEELWLAKDHEVIKKHVPKNYTMTTYNSLTQGRCPYVPLPFACCDGVADPSGCSGLAIVSRYPIKSIAFTMYNDHGPMADFEKLARKGFGKVRIEPKANLTIDVFVTHTCASDSDADKEARMSQVNQLMSAVRASTADFSILGGDFNSDPRAKNETTYNILKKVMSSSMEEFFKRIADWLVPTRASYGNPRNTYSRNYAPVLYDYIWHRSKKGNLVLTNFFDLPFLTTDIHVSKLLEEHRNATDNMATPAESINDKSTKSSGDLKSAEDSTSKSSKEIAKRSVRTVVERISLSDHEPVSASLLLFKGKH